MTRADLLLLLRADTITLWEESPSADGLTYAWWGMLCCACAACDEDNRALLRRLNAERCRWCRVHEAHPRLYGIACLCCYRGARRLHRHKTRDQVVSLLLSHALRMP